ncbi:PilZ domain-containing protein [Vibrio sp. RC27]
MQSTEILSIAERLIPVYHSDDFEGILDQMTSGKSPSLKLLVKMELNRLMTPCNRNVDLRGRVAGECHEYHLNGITHWLDDVAFNDYHRNYKKFGSYTDGVWESLYNTRNNLRVMRERGTEEQFSQEEETLPFEVEAIHLGYDLKRKENRLKIHSQVEIKLSRNQKIYGATSDISPSGARFKVPSTFEYGLGDIIDVEFSEFIKKLGIYGHQDPVSYRILGIDDIDETDSVKYLRAIQVNDSSLVTQIIDLSLKNEAQRARHDNQDKIIRARTRAFEHMFLKHACQLPVFFSNNELKAVLLTESNHDIWQYWKDERNQQTLSAMFNQERMALLAKPGVKGSSNTIYSFKHEHDTKTLFFSMMMPEASPEIRKLFWHLGAKRPSWRVFKVSIFELSEKERLSLETEQPELTEDLASLTHFGLLQEIGGPSTANDYQLVDKPNLTSKALAPFRQSRAVTATPMSVYFDARPQRKEPRYTLHSPILFSLDDREINGLSVDISKRGLCLKLDEPISSKIGTTALIDFKELKLYNKKLPLHRVEYKIVRVGSNGKEVQLVILDTPWSLKIINFFNRLIDINLDKLTICQEMLPSDKLLEALHHILLARVMCSPLFVERKRTNLQTKAIGVNYPLDSCMMMFAKLGRNERISLEPIFKGHTSSLLALPMKHIDDAHPQYNEIYIAVRKFGDRVRSVNVKLHSEFVNVRERIAFIEDSKLLGDVFVIRMSGTPVFDPITSLLKQDLAELSNISSYHARTIEKEMSTITGYGEIIDITDEVLIRLELAR